MNGRHFAIKVFEKLQLIAHLKGRDLIVNEINILKRLTHDQIVKLHEVYESGSTIYLVLEYIEGGDLYTQLKHSKKYSIQEIRALIQSILKALEYLHEKDIAHRDIKPSNIMLMSNNDITKVKLIDFGSAVDLLLPVKNTTYGGTPGYIAPEILNPKSEISLTGKIDIFAVGAIFYQLLTGSKLLLHQSNKEYSLDTCKLNMKEISNVTSHLLYKMLENEPTHRISASEALKHPFFKSDEKDIEKCNDKECNTTTSSKGSTSTNPSFSTTTSLFSTNKGVSKSKDGNTNSRPLSSSNNSTLSGFYPK